MTPPQKKGVKTPLAEQGALADSPQKEMRTRDHWGFLYIYIQAKIL